MVKEIHFHILLFLSTKNKEVILILNYKLGWYHESFVPINIISYVYRDGGFFYLIKKGGIIMYKTISAKAEHGIDALVRVTNILKRKEFQIRGLVMTECEIAGHSDLMITIEEDTNLGIEQAMMHLRKVINVYDIEEFTDISE